MGGCARLTWVGHVQYLCILFFINSFFKEIPLKYNKLHIFKMKNLVNLDVYV